MIPLTLMMLLAGTPAAQTLATSTDDAIIWDDYAPCGLVSLYLTCQIQEKAVSWEEIKKLVGPPGVGGELNFENLATAASQLGMHPVGLEVGRAALRDLPMPAIVQVHDARYPDELPHFLVLIRSEADGVWLLDAPFAAYFLPDERFQQSWTGKILVFAQNEQEAEQIRGLASNLMRLTWTAWGLIAAGALLLPVLGLIGWARRSKIGSLSPTVIESGIAQRGTPQTFPKSALWVGGAGLLLSICLLSLVLFWIIRKDADVPPRCDFGKQVLELGELTPGTHSIHVPIKNEGNHPLHINQVGSNCACCALVRKPDLIEPRQSATLDVELSVIPGPRNVRLTVESNDPEGPKHILLAWHGKAKPTLFPRWVAATSVPLDRSYERTIRLLYPGGKSALIPRLKSYECNRPGVELREGRNNPVANKFTTSGLVTNLVGELELHLRVQPPAEAGYFHAVCKLSLSYGNGVQTINLPLSLTFVGGQLAPNVNIVTFSATGRDELLSQVRLVRVADQDPRGEIEVLGVPPWLRCEIQKKTDKEHLLRLNVLSAPSAPFIQHNLKITRKGVGSIRSTFCINVIRPG